LPKHVGGIEIYVKSLSERLLQYGNDVLIFSGNGDVLWNPVCREETRDGLKVIQVYNKKPILQSGYAFFKTFKNDDVIRLFNGVLDSYLPDVVHVHHTMYLSGDIIASARNRGIPVVLTVHDFWFLCHKIHLLNRKGQRCQGPSGGLRCSFCLVSKYNSVLRVIMQLIYLLPLIYRSQYQLQILRSANTVVVPAMFAKDIICSYSGQNPKVKHIPYGIAAHQYSAEESAYSGNIVFGYLGSIKSHKGLHVLVEAFNEMTHENVTLNIYGDKCADESYYRQLVQNCRSLNVRFKGPYENSKVGEILSETDILIVPSVWQETGPLVILEALANRTPVIASNLGGMAELLKGGNAGLLFEPGSAESLRKCIRSVLQNPLMLKEFSPGLPDEYNIESNTSALLKIYGELCSK
jgi:glycosyltransferase involved in cell wall biosynthesis